MPIEKHDLLHEFPEHKDRIHELKLADSQFAKLLDEYHEIDHEIHGIEEGEENTSDEYLEGLKYKRLHHKDALLAIIKR